MRRIALTALAAATTLAVAVAPAHAAMQSVQGLKASISPNKAGTSKKPKNVSLTVNPFVTLNSADAPFATSGATIYLDKNLVFNTSRFKSCAASTVQVNEAKCPKGSKVGSGSAVGFALGLREDLKITAYNAPKGKGLNLLVVGSEPLTIRAVLDGKLAKASGAFGRKLIVPIPEGLQQPAPNAFATLTDFKVNLSSKQKVGGRSYVQLKGCTKRKLQFAGDFTFTNGEKQSPKTTVACKR
jgi:hypothetical protein